MGIPRLSKDVAPYAKTVVLGWSSAKSSTGGEIKSLVIDGPSLVYHVYNAIVHNHVPKVNIEDALSYVLINACLIQFLDDIGAAGAEIDTIIFDGALPPSKRPTRLERLEKTRQNLENYRKLVAHEKSSIRLTSVTSSPSFVLTSSELRHILWDHSAPAANGLRLLPPPPFMVPSVIENLQNSKWADKVRLVPGEADPYCAARAANSDAAILSNDSDLLLYDLGPRGSVVTLRSLELEEQASAIRSGVLQGQYLRPSEIARSLCVSSMLRFGYERRKDPSVNTSVVADRARQQLSANDEPMWLQFQQEYKILDSSISDQVSPSEFNRPSVQNLDPRTSELVAALDRSESLHMYLPIILEDPSRDSAWSYGHTIRCLAYSILLSGEYVTSGSKEDGHIIEHLRKGPRIASHKVQNLSTSDMVEETRSLVDLLDCYVTEKTKDSRILDVKGNKHILSGKHTTNEQPRTMPYFFAAADVAIKERISRSKAYEPSFTRLFSHGGLTSRLVRVLDWEDLHLHASIQCVLYSLRILKQIVDLMVQTHRCSRSTQERNAMLDLHVRLANMPTISDLFLGAIAFHNALQTFPVHLVANCRMRLLQRVDSVGFRSAQLQLSNNVSIHEPGIVGDSKTPWQEIGQGRKKRRTVRSSNNIVPSDRAQVTNRLSGKDNPANGFALLQQFEDSSDPGQ